MASGRRHPPYRSRMHQQEASADRGGEKLIRDCQLLKFRLCCSAVKARTTAAHRGRSLQKSVVQKYAPSNKSLASKQLFSCWANVFRMRRRDDALSHDLELNCFHRSSPVGLRTQGEIGRIRRIDQITQIAILFQRVTFPRRTTRLMVSLVPDQRA